MPTEEPPNEPAAESVSPAPDAAPQAMAETADAALAIKPTLAKPDAAAKAVAIPKPAAASRPAAAPVPAFKPNPTLPVSMIVRPDSAFADNTGALFPGELPVDFDTALKQVAFAPPKKSLASIFQIMRRLLLRRTQSKTEVSNISRTVAFDGFRADLYDEKLERDRRYGTVYTVLEEVNAFIVSLEFPRRMPESALRETWKLPDEMPNYAYAIGLADDVLCVRAGLPDEARRRLSYVSSSFPSDFETRIEFGTPVKGFRHRLCNKVLQIIVFKKDQGVREERPG
jgi:hypothetical protein